MLTVHHLNNSRSQRVLWLLEELGVPYQIERYQRDPKTMLAPPALKKVHQLGKSPVPKASARLTSFSSVSSVTSSPGRQTGLALMLTTRLTV